MCLDGNNHSVFKLIYKLILTTNNLAPIISKEISDRLKEICLSIAPDYNISLIGWESRDSIIEICFTSHPNTELSKFINAYKSAASRLIKKEFSHIKDNLYNGQFWSKTFILLTIDNGINSKEVDRFIDKLRRNDK